MHHVDRALLSPHSNFIIEKRDGTENARHDKSARWILKAKQKNRNKEESAGGGNREEIGGSREEGKSAPCVCGIVVLHCDLLQPLEDDCTPS